MVNLLLNDAIVLPPNKMARKIALAILEDSTISLSHPWPSMLLNAIANHSMEPSRELATAVSLMLSTCRQDRCAQSISMHPAAIALSLSFLLLLKIAIAKTASSSITLPPISLLNPQIVLASKAILLHPLELLPKAHAAAAQESLIWSDHSVHAKLD